MIKLEPFSWKLFVNKYLNPSKWVLLLVVLITLFNCFLEYRLVEYKNAAYRQQVSVRILDVKKDSFGSLSYTGLYKNEVWQVVSKSYLQIGWLIKDEANLIPFKFSDDGYSSDEYKLTIGMKGKIILSDKAQYKNDCDYICNIIRTQNKIKVYVQNRYYSFSCVGFGKQTENFLGEGECQNVYGLSYGLILGGTDKFTKTGYTNIKFVGLTHLVAVSGFQVVLLLTFLEWLAGYLSIPKKWQIFIIILGILILLLLVGPQPPVLRSSVSVLLSWSLLTFFGRKISAIRTLIYSGIILLLINPFFLWSISFQLSFLASFGLWIASRFDSKSREESVLDLSLFNGIKSAFLVSFFAFLATLPIVLNISKQLNIFSIIINVTVTPLIPIISVLNLIGLIPWLGDIFLYVGLFLQTVLLLLINFTVSFIPDWLILHSEKVQVWEYYFYYGLLIMFAVFIDIYTFAKTRKNALKGH